MLSYNSTKRVPKKDNQNTPEQNFPGKSPFSEKTNKNRDTIKERYENLTLHSCCRTCSHFRNHSYLRSKTFSDENRKRTRMVTNEERVTTMIKLTGTRLKGKPLPEFIERLRRVCQIIAIRVSRSHCSNPFVDLLPRRRRVLFTRLSREIQCGEYSGVFYIVRYDFE